MKTCRMALLLAIMLLMLTGCAFPEPHPIEKIQNIIIAGVDIEDGQIRLTVVTDKIEAGGPAGEAKVEAQMYSATGSTIFEAARTLRSSAEKHLSWFHLNHIVIGEETARDDIKRVLDPYSELYESRFTHKLMVVKGMTAAEFLEKVVTPEGGINDYLDSLFKEAELTGKSAEVRLLDYARSFESAWSDPLIPTVEVIPSVQQDPEYLVVLNGYALFNDNRLAGYLDGRQAMGVNIVINKIKTAEITVTDMNGQPVSLQVSSSKADIKTDLSDMPSATISIVIDSFLAEFHQTAGATMDEYIGYLEAQQNNYVLSVIADALAEAQRCGTDVFGIGSAMYHAHPVASEKIRDNWEELFPVMSISINVVSTITGTYHMTDAVGK